MRDRSIGGKNGWAYPILRCDRIKIEVSHTLAKALQGFDRGHAMAKQPKKKPDNTEGGKERQDRIQREQHRPEQNEGYDEAVQRPGIANDREIPPDQRPRRDI